MRIRAVWDGAGSRGGLAERAAKAVGGRDFEALRQRRMEAARMFDRGARQVEVARGLGGSAPAASRWYRGWCDGGRWALTGAGRAGRPSRLSDTQLRLVEKALLRGPCAHGYPTDMWTLDRVAGVIEKLTGVRYASTQTWTILSGSRPACSGAAPPPAAPRTAAGAIHACGSRPIRSRSARSAASRSSFFTRR